MSFSRPPMFEYDRSSVIRGQKTGALRKQTTVLNSDMNRGIGGSSGCSSVASVRADRPFESKPLNQPTILRQRWTDRKPANAQKYVSDGQEEAIMKRFRTQKRLEDREKGRAKKERIRATPQMGQTTLPSDDECQCTRTNNQCAEPQMFRSYMPSMGLDQETLATVNGMTDAVQAATETLGQVADMLSTTVNTLAPEGKIRTEITAQFDQGLSKTLSNISEFAFVVVVLIIIVLLKPKTQTERVLVYAILMSVAMTRVNLGALLEQSGVLGLFGSKNVNEPQIFDSLNSDDVNTVLSSMINLYVLGHFGTDLLEPKELLRVTSQISRMTPTLTNITAGVQIIVGFLSKVFTRYLRKDAGFVRTGHEFIDSFFKEFEEIVDAWERKELHCRQSSIDRVKKCIKYGQEMVHLIPSNKDFVTIRMQMTQALRDLERLRTKLMSSNFFFEGVRQEPATLLLMGKPGVFKSQAMQHIANAISALTLTPAEYERFKENPTATTYNRQAESVYWEGYGPHKHIVMIDDLGQARDIQGNPDNEVFNVIRMINIFENILHMAAIEDKGNTHFRSKFVIANTNLFSFNFESINEIGAFMRRWHVVATVVPKAEYCEDPDAAPLQRRFDPLKFPVFTEETCRGRPELIGTTRTHPDMCEFHIQRLLPSGTCFVDSGEIVGFEEIVLMLLAKFRQQELHGSGYEVTLDDTLDKYRDLYTEPQMNVLSDAGQSMEFGSHPSKVVVSKPDSHGFRQVYMPFDPHREKVFPNIVEMPVLPSAVLMFDKVKENYDLVHCVFDSMHFGLRDPSPRRRDRFFQDVVHHIEAFFWETIGISIDMYNQRYPSVTEVMFYDLLAFLDKKIIDDKTFRLENCDHGNFAILTPVQYKMAAHMAVPQAGDFSSTPVRGSSWSSSLSLDDEYRVPGYGSARGLSYVVDEAHRRRLDILRAQHFELYSLYDATMKIVVSRESSPEGVVIDLNELLDVMFSIDNLDDYRKGGQFMVFSFADTAWERYLLRNREVIARPDREIIRSTLERVGGAATDLQKRVYAYYNQCMQYLLSLGGYDSEMSFSVLLESESLRRKLYIGGAVIGGFAVAFRFAKHLFGSMHLFGDAQSDERSNRVGRNRRVNRRPNKPFSVPQALASSNKNVANVMRMITTQCMYEIEIPRYVEEPKGDRTHVKAGYALALRGRSVLCPWHFWSWVWHGTEEFKASDGEEGIDPDSHILFRRTHNGVVHIVLKAQEFVDAGVMWDEGDDRDLILLTMPVRYQPTRDIVHHIAPEKQHRNYTKVNAALCIPVDGKEVHVVPAKQTDNIVVGGDRWSEYTIDSAYSYPAQTNAGDCGSILYANDKVASPTIIGMHVAGVASMEKGHSARLVREYVEAYLHFANETYNVEPLGEGENKLHLEPASDDIADQFIVGKATPESAVPARMMKSAIERSPLHNTFFVSPRMQSQLRPLVVNGERVDPLHIARAGYCPGDVYIPEEYLDSAKDSLLDFLLHNSSRGVEKCILNFEEAVLGMGPGSAMQSINRKTSSGYPYNVLCRPSNKTYFFGDGDEYDLTNSKALELKHEVERCLDQLKRGIRCNFVFTDSLKDEKRPIEKVAQGKTRMFSGSPLVYTILCRMYFGKFAEWCTVNRVDNGMAIGVNQYSTEWDEVARKLNSLGDGANKGAGDFAGLDKKHKAQVMIKLFDLVNQWYAMDGFSAEDNRVREMLSLDLTNSLHVNEGTFLYWVGAMPSGHFLTALFNSLAVHLYFRMSWIDIVRPKSMDAHEFNEMIYLIVLGDDNVFAVHPKYVHIFTEAALGPSMSKWGHEYTPESKSGELGAKLRTIEEVSFLKRKWRFDESLNRWLCPLDLQTVLDIPNWVKKGGNRLGDTEMNLENCVAELVLHGPEVYNSWIVRIVKAIEDVPGLSVPAILSYRQRLNETLARAHDDYDLIRPLTDYDTEGDNTTVNQPQSGRFLGQGAGLFRLTSRIARRQPRLYPGTRGDRSGSARPLLSILGVATIVDQMGDSTTGREIVTQEQEGSSSLTSGTTNASVDAGVVKGVLPYKALSRSLLQTVQSSVSNEIRDFLAKPKLIYSGVLSTTDAFTTNVWSAWVPNGLINTSGDIWQNKLEGMLYFRGTLHLVLNVNGNRFQQGRYILAFCPTGGGVNSLTFKNTHCSSLTLVTQLPHVEFDVNCDTEASLTVPLVNAQGWVPISTGSTVPNLGAAGFCFLTAYSPLVAAAGSTTASCSIFAHFTDVEIALPAVPQSGRNGVRGKIKRRPRTSEIEQDSGGIGPIESSASTVALIARQLTGVPLLSSVAAPVSWVADLVRNAAASYGWARPRNEGVTVYMSKQIMHRAANVDAQDNSTKLALFDRNELSDLPDFAGTDVDEMSLQYLQTISAFFYSTTWTTGQTIGTLVNNQILTPRGFYQQKSQASQTVSHLVPLSYVANMFGMYRGSFVLTIKLVKTEFHSGRLAVVFSPNTSPMTSPVAPTINQTQFLHREIIDVRMGNEFTFTFPYVGLSQYRPCCTTLSDSPIGYVYIFVLNPLVAPANVSSSVTVLMEIAGGSDFEFAQPRNPSGVPVTIATPQIGRSDCEIVARKVGGASTAPTHMAAETCIGERILSFRSLLKKFTQILPNAGVALTNNRFTTVVPHAITMSTINVTPAYQVSSYRSDMFDRIAPMYAFYRGGMRMKFINHNKEDDTNLIVASAPLAPAPWTVGATVAANVINGVGIDLLNRPFCVARGDAQGSAEVEFPFYSMYPMMCTSDYIVNDAATAPTIFIDGTGAVGPRVCGYATQSDGTSNTHYPLTLYRAIAEDGSLGMFVSTIPLVGYVPGTWN